MTSFRAALGDEQVPGLADPVQVGGLRVPPPVPDQSERGASRTCPVARSTRAWRMPRCSRPPKPTSKPEKVTKQVPSSSRSRSGSDPGQVERHAVAPRPYSLLRGEHDVSPTGDRRHDDVEHPVVNTDGRCVDTRARRSRLDAELFRASGDVTDQLPVLEISGSGTAGGPVGTRTSTSPAGSRRSHGRSTDPGGTQPGAASAAPSNARVTGTFAGRSGPANRSPRDAS